jgi:peptidoglycan/LPS O-acetylase OafA/YrhL
MENKNKNLRLDIQGLRALAVLSVVIFHISPEHLTGGYLGVDVFFVISGYLIMGQIWRALNDNRFNFIEFYTKRFKRLLPALIVVLAISSVAAFFLLLPSEYRSYSYSVFSSLFYVSNFWFYSKSGYFDAELQGAPLLHTWSLSVEEQFYFIFPFLLAFLYKVCNKTSIALLTLIGIAIATLVMSEWLLSYDQSLSFYASPTRFWQFIVGGLLAMSNVSRPKQFLSQCFSVLGLVSLVVVFFIYTEKTPFPGLMALPVTLATALVIYARTEHGPVGWLLTNPVSNFFGNISYSLYLWHWPVLIFYKIYLFDEFIEYEKFEKISVLLVSIILATLTYLYVEKPFKNARIGNKNTQPIVLSLALSLGLALAVFGSSYFQHYRFTEQTKHYEAYLGYGNPFSPESCFLSSRRNNVSLFDQENCIKTEQGKFNILLMGDSHAKQWFSAMDRHLKPNQTLSVVTASGCKPVIPLQGEDRCTELLNWAMKELIVNHKFDKIIISGRWKSKHVQYIPETIATLQEYASQVQVIGPVIEYLHPLPMLLAKFGPDAELTQFSIYENRKELDSQLEATTDLAGGNYMSPLTYMCSSIKRCQYTSKTNVPMQFDYGHLTHEGAMAVIATSLKDE